MAAVPQKNTVPEVALRRALFRKGLRYSLHPKLPGSPDIALVRHKTAIFVHGCFWHRHAKCRLASTPSTRREFWLAKFDANVVRDKVKRSDLKRLGWRSVVVWQCQIDKSVQTVASRILIGLKRRERCDQNDKSKGSRNTRSSSSDVRTQRQIHTKRNTRSAGS